MSSRSFTKAATQLTEPHAAVTSRFSPSPRKHVLLLSLLLVVGVLVFYSSITHNGFLNYDDDTYITNNVHVRAGLSWPTVAWAFTTYEAANYHPMTWLLHALNCQLFGLNAMAHHEVDVMLHAVNAVILFWLLIGVTGFVWRSWFVAALFAFHPVNVESVAWAAEQKNVLSMLLFLSALHAYFWYARRPAFLRYALVAFVFALALLSKPQVITLPFLLLLLDYWPLDRFRARSVAAIVRDRPLPKFSSRWLILEKAPLLLLSATSAVVTINAQGAGGAIQNLSQYAPVLRFETAVISYVRYLGKAFWPSKLVALYPRPTALYPAWQVGAAVLLLLLLTAGALHARERRYILVGWLWFLGSLVPMIGLVQVGWQSIADRYAYISFLGLFLILIWLVADWAEARYIAATRLAIPAFVLLCVLGTLTFRQVTYWHDVEEFWLRTIALTENNFFAQDSLSDLLFRQGRTEEAAVHFRAALAIRPDDIPANLNLGTYEYGRGNWPAALEHYQMVARFAADTSLRATAFGNLGIVYRQLGDVTQAKQCFEMAVQLAPDFPMAIIGLGLIAQTNGDLPEAVRQYSHAMAVEPTDVGYLLLAGALEQQGRSAEARTIREKVARLSPDLVAAHKQVQALLFTK